MRSMPTVPKPMMTAITIRKIRTTRPSTTLMLPVRLFASLIVCSIISLIQLAAATVSRTEQTAIKSFHTVMLPEPIGMAVASSTSTRCVRTPKNCRIAKIQNVTTIDLVMRGEMMLEPTIACRSPKTIASSE